MIQSNRTPIQFASAVPAAPAVVRDPSLNLFLREPTGSIEEPRAPFGAGSQRVGACAFRIFVIPFSRFSFEVRRVSGITSLVVYGMALLVLLVRLAHLLKECFSVVYISLLKACNISISVFEIVRLLARKHGLSVSGLVASHARTYFFAVLGIFPPIHLAQFVGICGVPFSLLLANRLSIGRAVDAHIFALFFGNHLSTF